MLSTEVGREREIRLAAAVWSETIETISTGSQPESLIMSDHGLPALALAETAKLEPWGFSTAGPAGVGRPSQKKKKGAVSGTGMIQGRPSISCWRAWPEAAVGPPAQGGGVSDQRSAE